MIPFSNTNMVALAALGIGTLVLAATVAFVAPLPNGRSSGATSSGVATSAVRSASPRTSESRSPMQT
jgi:hypothetical protein